MKHHAAHAVGNIAERLEGVIRLLETVLVIDVEVTRHRLFVGISRVDGMVVCEWEELVEEFLDHSFQFLLVEGSLRGNMTAIRREKRSRITNRPGFASGKGQLTFVYFCTVPESACEKAVTFACRPLRTNWAFCSRIGATTLIHDLGARESGCCRSSYHEKRDTQRRCLTDENHLPLYLLYVESHKPLKLFSWCLINPSNSFTDRFMTSVSVLLSQQCPPQISPASDKNGNRDYSHESLMSLSMFNQFAAVAAV